LERDRLSDDGKLFLYRAKTGVAVCVPIPPDVAEVLRALPSVNPRYFFCRAWHAQTACKGCAAPHSAVRNRQHSKTRWNSKALPRSYVRDTFAVELLNKGVPIDRVSLLLGIGSVKVTEKHYAPFVKERQQQLEVYARMAWEDSRWMQGISKAELNWPRSLPLLKSTEALRSRFWDAQLAMRNCRCTRSITVSGMRKFCILS